MDLAVADAPSARPVMQSAHLGRWLVCKSRGRGIVTFEETGPNRPHRMLRAVFADGSNLQGIEMILRAHGVAFLNEFYAGETEHASLMGHNAAQGLGLVERPVRAELQARKVWAA